MGMGTGGIPTTDNLPETTEKLGCPTDNIPEATEIFGFSTDNIPDNRFFNRLSRVNCQLWVSHPYPYPYPRKFSCSCMFIGEIHYILSFYFHCKPNKIRDLLIYYFGHSHIAKLNVHIHS